MANDDAWARGLDVVDTVYGPKSRAMMEGLESSKFVSETVEHVFGDIWAAPHLSIRDKRLIVIGATTMLGREDLLEVQLAGAIFNKELTDDQLDEMLLLMMFYCGAGNATSLSRGISAAKARAAAMESA